MFFDKIPEKAWVIFSSFSGTGLVILCVSVGSIAIRSSDLTYTSKDTQININGDAIKKISNDTEYANAQLQKKILLLEAEINNLQKEDTPGIRRAIEEIKPVVKEIDGFSAELETIAE
jgi:hypothetical protein